MFFKIRQDHTLFFILYIVIYSTNIWCSIRMYKSYQIAIYKKYNTARFYRWLPFFFALSLSCCIIHCIVLPYFWGLWYISRFPHIRQYNSKWSWDENTLSTNIFPLHLVHFNIICHSINQVSIPYFTEVGLQQ